MFWSIFDYKSLIDIDRDKSIPTVRPHIISSKTCFNLSLALLLVSQDRLNQSVGDVSHCLL